jgi:hypothetical protein
LTDLIETEELESKKISPGNTVKENWKSISFDYGWNFNTVTQTRNIRVFKPKMSIITQPNEILIIIMSFLDAKSIVRLCRCSKRLSIVFLDDYLWALKLASDYKMGSHKTLTSIEFYKWCIRLSSINEIPKNDSSQSLILEAVKTLGHLVLIEFENKN